MAVIYAKAYLRRARSPRHFPTVAPPPEQREEDWKASAMNLARLAESYQVAYIESRAAFVGAMMKAGVKPTTRLLDAERANVAHRQIERLLKDPEVIDAMNTVKREILRGSGILRLGEIH